MFYQQRNSYLVISSLCIWTVLQFCNITVVQDLKHMLFIFLWHHSAIERIHYSISEVKTLLRSSEWRLNTFHWYFIFTGQYGYASIYGELPEYEMKRDQIPAAPIVPSDRPWETVFSGPSHVLPPLTKLCSAFLASLLEKRPSVQQWSPLMVFISGDQKKTEVAEGISQPVDRVSLEEELRAVSLTPGVQKGR